MTVVLRTGLALLASMELALGLWTMFFPMSFYDNVPTVNLTPPFSEHLFRDFGGETLGIGIVLAAAMIWPETKLVIVALLAYLAFAIPHFIFHLGHLNGATELEAATLSWGLGASAVIPVLLLVLALVRMRHDRDSATEQRSL